ncbi:MAG: glycosyltransferase [Armatimonadota bacterium]
MCMKRKCILVITGAYLPGYKGGGPIRSVANIVDHTAGIYDFRILTSDRDFGDNAPYPNIVANTWQKVGNAQVCYLSRKKQSFSALRDLLLSSSYDVYYLNSIFSPVFTLKILLLYRLKLIPQVPVILAPRGELCPGALQLKNLKKTFFLRIAKLCGFYRNITWQATAPTEAENIRSAIGTGEHIVIAPNLPAVIDDYDQYNLLTKEPGELKIIFLSRIGRKKNLYGAIGLLRGVTGRVIFDIYGPREDMEYWRECEALITKLPDNLIVRYCGEVPHHTVKETFSRYHVFLFPTFSENFGHVILEAMQAGCLPVISNQTPWHNLECQCIGWDIPLNATDDFCKVLQKCVDMDNEVYQHWSVQAISFAKHYSMCDELVALMRQLFDVALSEE